MTKSNQSAHLLKKICDHEHSETVIVFDLDSTLFDVTPRNQEILRAFASDEKIIELFPTEVEVLKRLKVESRDWGIKDTLTRAFPSWDPKFVRMLREYWGKRFFSSELLHVDVPYTGAVDYVNHLHNKSFDVVYLTGRDHRNMHPGTIKSLAAHKFPRHDPSHDALIMKPIKGSIEDEDFKLIELLKLKDEYKHVWFFENEPVIIHKITENLPEVNIIFVDTVHSGKADPPTHLPVIPGHYLIED